MAKFKKGDWVRFSGPLRSDGPAVGDVGNLVEDDDGAPFVHWNGLGKRYAIRREDLEPWQPRVGERVRIVKYGMRSAGGSGHQREIGSEWVVSKIENAFWQGVRTNGPDLFFSEIEPATAVASEQHKFKVGDRVRLITIEGFDESQVSVGSIAKVTSVPRNPDALYNLEFTKPFGGAVTQVAFARDFELVDAAPIKIEAGKTYIDADGNRVGPMIDFYEGRLIVVCGDGRVWNPDGSGFSDSSPRLVAIAPDIESAIVCIIEDGQPAPADKPRVHTVDGANAEAARLASEHPGKEFGVYVLTGATHEVEKTYDHEWQRLAAAGKRREAQKELRRVSGLTEFSAASCIGRFYGELAA